MNIENVTIGFGQVDAARKPGDFVQYLDNVQSLTGVENYKKRTFDLLGSISGKRLLDVGCGAGDDTRALAEAVGKNGLVVGVDNSATMIQTACERAENAGLPIEYRVSAAENLDFPDKFFDAARSDRVFQHLDAPLEALREIVRVTRTNGKIVISEPDWDTLVIDCADKKLTRKIVHFHCDSVRQGWIGRRLPNIFREAGLTEITIDASALMFTDGELADRILGVKSAAFRAQQAGIITDEEAVKWLEELRQADRAGKFFCAMTGFAVVGEKI